MLRSLNVVQSSCPSYLLPHSLLFSTVIYSTELAPHPKPCSSCLSSAEGAQTFSAVWLPLIEQLSTLSVQKPTDKPTSGCQHTDWICSAFWCGFSGEYWKLQTTQNLEMNKGCSGWSMTFSVSTKQDINSSCTKVGVNLGVWYTLSRHVVILWKQDSNPARAVCRPCSVPYYKTAKSKPAIKIILH